MTELPKSSDLRADVPLSRPWFDENEVEAAAEVVRSEWLISGPRVQEFERRFGNRLGGIEAIAVNSGSSALLVALAALGVGPGDEVLVPDVTFVSTASAAMFLGARPVFVDINLQYYCLDPKDVEKKITSKTKVIIPVHYAGHAADLDEILDLAQKYGLRVLEDAAESHLSKYKAGAYTGTLGDVGIFSFTPSKPMTTGEGGMIVTHDAEIARRCRILRDCGDTAKFRWDVLGFNFRMPEVMAAIGLAQLEKLDRAVSLRRMLAARYEEALGKEESVILPRLRTPEDGNFQLFTIRLQTDCLAVDRDSVIQALGARRVSTRLYYPPLHSQGVFAVNGILTRDIELLNSIEFGRTALSLPIYPTMTSAEQDFVVSALKDTLKANRR